MNYYKVYDSITDKIINLLEQHSENNYQNEWFSFKKEPVAFNPLSDRAYTGINQFLLNMSAFHKGYFLNRWLTFKMVNDLKGSIDKGSKATAIIFADRMYIDEKLQQNVTNFVKTMISAGKANEINPNIKGIPFIKEYYVFNVSQVKGLPEQYYKKEETKDLTPVEKNEEAERITANCGASFLTQPQNRAFYNTGKDLIILPEDKQFKDTEGYYTVLFHELGHWTGNKTRLDRKLNGDKYDYAREELTAELCAAFCCARLGMESKISNNAEYIKSWLQLLKDDRTAVVKAAAHAQKAADYIFSEATKLIEQAA